MKLVKLETYYTDEDDVQTSDIAIATGELLDAIHTNVQIIDAEIALRADVKSLEDYRSLFADPVDLKIPTGEELYLMVCSRFNNGYFAWDIIPENTRKAWSDAASELFHSPDTILGRK